MKEETSIKGGLFASYASRQVSTTISQTKPTISSSSQPFNYQSSSITEKNDSQKSNFGAQIVNGGQSSFGGRNSYFESNNGRNGNGAQFNGINTGTQNNYIGQNNYNKQNSYNYNQKPSSGNQKKFSKKDYSSYGAGSNLQTSQTSTKSSSDESAFKSRPPPPPSAFLMSDFMKHNIGANSGGSEDTMKPNNSSNNSNFSSPESRPGRFLIFYTILIIKFFKLFLFTS